MRPIGYLLSRTARIVKQIRRVIVELDSKKPAAAGFLHGKS
jgi:hypothetical protein